MARFKQQYEDFEEDKFEEMEFEMDEKIMQTEEIAPDTYIIREEFAKEELAEAKRKFDGEPHFVLPPEESLLYYDHNLGKQQDEVKVILKRKGIIAVIQSFEPTFDDVFTQIYYENGINILLKGSLHFDIIKSLLETTDIKPYIEEKFLQDKDKK